MAKFEWSEKTGMLDKSEGEPDRNFKSEAEAKAFVLQNPTKYQGYSVGSGGRVVFARQRGSKLISSIKSYKTYLLFCPCIRYAGEPFHDKYVHGCTNGLENGTKKHDFKAVWKRPGRGEGLYDSEQLSLWRTLEPNDVIQGGIGDCWLMSTIAALAEFPERVMQLFQTKELSPEGKYEIDLFSWADKKMHRVTIDDRLATKGGDVSPLFGQITADGELYVALLEKAVACLCGGYDFLDGNNPTFALFMLTGCTEVYHFLQPPIGAKHSDKEPLNHWIGGREDFVKNCKADYMSPVANEAGMPSIMQGLKSMPSYDANNHYAWRFTDNAWGPGEHGSVPRDQHSFWKTLEKWDQQGFVMICDTCCGQGSSDKCTFPCGLPYKHAYSLIQVKSHVCGHRGLNLAQIRNPHGKNEPNLPWHDKDPLWAKHPDVAEALGHEDKVDGTFWVTEDDFFKHFYNVFVLKQAQSSKVAERQNALVMDLQRMSVKPAAPPQQPGGYPAGAPTGGFSVGDEVEYFSKSNQKWYKCTVLKLDGDQAQVSCKPGAWVAVSGMRKNSAPPATPVQQKPVDYIAGELVEYYAASLRKWLPCEVVRLEGESAAVSCKPGALVPLRSLRKVVAPSYAVGDEVEVYCRSLSGWVRCKVAKTDGDKCEHPLKPGEWLDAADQRAKLRAPTATQPVVRNGTKVFYKSSQGLLLTSIVVEPGRLELACKPGVLVTPEDLAATCHLAVA